MRRQGGADDTIYVFVSHGRDFADEQGSPEARRHAPMIPEGRPHIRRIVEQLEQIEGEASNLPDRRTLTSMKKFEQASLRRANQL